MTEHEDREAHEAEADQVERELDQMEERAERLQGDTEGAGDDWERKKRDESVPGAPTPDGQDDGDGDPGEELDFGRDLGSSAGDDR
jgi:hypothetical protein